MNRAEYKTKKFEKRQALAERRAAKKKFRFRVGDTVWCLDENYNLLSYFSGKIIGCHSGIDNNLYVIDASDNRAPAAVISSSGVFKTKEELFFAITEWVEKTRVALEVSNA